MIAIYDTKFTIFQLVLVRVLLAVMARVGGRDCHLEPASGACLTALIFMLAIVESRLGETFPMFELHPAADPRPHSVDPKIEARMCWLGVEPHVVVHLGHVFA